MSAKLRQSPDFTKGLQDVLGRKGIKHRFRPKQMKCSALFRLYPLNMVKKSTQNESTTLENEPSQVQKKRQTTHFLLTNYAPHPFPLVSVRLYHRDGTSLKTWWKRLTLTKERFVDWSEAIQNLVVQAFYDDLMDTHPYFTKLHRIYSWVVNYSVRVFPYRYESFPTGRQQHCCTLVLLKQKSRQEKQKITVWITLKTKKLRFIIK